MGEVWETILALCLVPVAVLFCAWLVSFLYEALDRYIFRKRYHCEEDEVSREAIREDRAGFWKMGLAHMVGLVVGYLLDMPWLRWVIFGIFLVLFIVDVVKDSGHILRTTHFKNGSLGKAIMADLSKITAVVIWGWLTVAMAVEFGLLH